MTPPTLRRFVAYYRVSTDRQGRSGLGLDAQREAVAGQVRRAAGMIVADFTEIESGKRADRPELRVALAEAKRHRATLIIARLDRLSRNMAFIANLMDARVEFVACDNPHATRLTLHILAAVAEHEREMISARTRAALAVAKARGVRLGNPRAALARERAAATHRATADKFAATVHAAIGGMAAQGMSLRAIARELDQRGVPTARGGVWQAVQVRNVLARWLLSPAPASSEDAGKRIG